jgi:hypothetical protein
LRADILSFSNCPKIAPNGTRFSRTLSEAEQSEARRLDTLVRQT